MEWTVVTVMIALVGLVAAVVKPVMSLTNAITKLTTIVDSLVRDLERQTTKNSEGHTRLWEHNKAQDERIDDHETRLTVIERM